MNDRLRELISKNVSASQIKKLAMEYGMKTLFMDGMDKAFHGQTSVEEVLRVTEDSL